MKWQLIAIILASILIGTGVLTYTDLFGVLFQLTGVEATHSGDSYCKELCPTYINITTSYWRICFAHYSGTQYSEEVLFKKRSRSRTLHVNLNKVTNLISTEPRVEVDWLVPARGKGNWREIKDGDCWDRKKINKIKLVGHKKEWQDVKWSFEVGDYVEIDPFWLSGIEVGDKVVKELCVPLYKTWTDEIPHNKICTNCYNTTIEVNESDGYDIFNETNGTYYKIGEKCYNYSCLDYIEKIEHINEQVDCIKTGKVDVDGKIYEGNKADCILGNTRICCYSDKEGGKHSATYRTDGSVDKECEDLITGERELISSEGKRFITIK